MVKNTEEKKIVKKNQMKATKVDKKKHKPEVEKEKKIKSTQQKVKFNMPKPFFNFEGKWKAIWSYDVGQNGDVSKDTANNFNLHMDLHFPQNNTLLLHGINNWTQPNGFTGNDLDDSVSQNFKPVKEKVIGHLDYTDNKAYLREFNEKQSLIDGPYQFTLLPGNEAHKFGITCSPDNMIVIGYGEGAIPAPNKWSFSIMIIMVMERI